MPRCRPEAVESAQLLEALQRCYQYTRRQAQAAAGRLRKFMALQVGDRVVVCRGYNEESPIFRLHGIAIVTERFRSEPLRREGAWRFKVGAQIIPIEQSLPISGVRGILGGSFLGMVHGLSGEQYERLIALSEGEK